MSYLTRSSPDKLQSALIKGLDAFGTSPHEEDFLLSLVKKIPVSQLRLGMHIHEFCGSWMDHPFWRSKFTLTKPEDLRRIVDGGVKDLWIDASKGLDVVDTHAAVVTQEVAARQTEQELEFVASMPMMLDEAGADDAAFQKAAALYRSSVPKISSLFAEVRLGSAIDAQQCELLVEEIS